MGWWTLKRWRSNLNPEMPDATCAAAPEDDIAKWVHQARLGSHSAFANLYERFSPLVHAILLGRFQPVIADDLTQECFITAHQRLEQLNDPAKFGPWIAVIARRIKPAAELRRRTESDIDDLASLNASPEQVIDANRVLSAVATLPEAYRNTLMMRLAEGMSGPEIAAATGMTHQSVRVNLHRGMARLRQILGLPSQPTETSHE
ncbi:RNA polymerase sigma factor [Aerolutibacter daejeonensis]|uniref:RNA polymerase sigma factor n=1 Tax=Aerolutibacter daejeonensis TaxID=346181 RepID=UPI0009FEE800|nr:sigma-70 family RNA polymerase sigma factor [Lysobacter daejeonensis]